MLSPFPGIDPYLEDPAYWSDFHARFISYWGEAIADALPPNYEAGLGERVQVYAWPMSHPLPTLPVPLRAPDPDLAISLSEVYSTAYDRGRFQRRIDYRGQIPSQLRPVEIPGAEDVIKGLGT